MPQDWEDWLAHFTDLLYNVYISMATANGELAPLVGHNATLSWEVMDEVSWMDESSGYRCWWSEAHVSEDFDMCLRMTSGNYEGRYVTYTGSGFKEGVSVTVFEEITKLKKYAYGAGEMLFNPLIMWPRHGILSPLMTKFLRSNVRFDHVSRSRIIKSTNSDKGDLPLYRLTNSTENEYVGLHVHIRCHVVGNLYHTSFALCISSL